MKQHKKPLRPVPSRLASAVRNGIRADANHPVRDAVLRASNAVTSHAIGALGAGVSTASALSHAGEIARGDASETFGGVRVSNKTIRRHAGALADIARSGGRDNPKTHHITNSPEARREVALQHLTSAASTNRDDADAETHGRAQARQAEVDERRRALHDFYGGARAQSRGRKQSAARAFSASDKRLQNARDIEASELDAQPAEDHKMASVAEVKRRLDAMREEIDKICDTLGDDEVRDDESAEERSEAASLGDYHRHGEHESEKHVRDDADESEEHKAGEELARGAKDEREGDEHEGEEDEHDAGEELAAGRDDAESETERSEASEEGHEHHDEERGDKSPTELAEPITEADAMTSDEHAAAARKAWRTRKRDDAQGDSDGAIRSKIAALEARLSRAIRPVSREERDAMAQAQARCDSVAQMFGLRAEPPLAGEHLDAYRRRLVAPLQKYSKDFAKANIDRLDAHTFAGVERHIYADAQAAAKMDDSPVAGRLTPVRSTDAAGRTITKYYGDPNAWMAPFKARGVSIRFNRDSNR